MKTKSSGESGGERRQLVGRGHRRRQAVARRRAGQGPVAIPTAGVAKGTYLFALPGSPGACKDGWDGILKDQLDYRHMPCNFVELMPRLMEKEEG